METLEGFPSFFVVGAQKAGTTSLHNWLNQQPDICLPKKKETHFFSSREKYERGIDWYLRQFPRRQTDTIVGEVGPEYMFSTEAPSRIREWIRAPKLIFIFRHPIERAFSNYQMAVTKGYESESFYNALLKEHQRLSCGGDEMRSRYGYMARGRYVEQVDCYKRFFPESEFLFVKFDDLTANGKRGLIAYRSICEFIGLRSSPLVADRSEKANAASAPRSILLRDFLHESSLKKRLLGKLLPNKRLREQIALRLDTLNQRSVERREVGRVPRDIIEEAKEGIVRLEALTKWDLRDWVFRANLLLRK